MRILPTLLLIALLPVAAAAQDAGMVRGRVVAEATGAPLAGASVAVRAATDSAVVTGGRADGDGEFRFGDLGPGRYRVEATAAGYAPYAGRWVTIAEGAPEVELGEIRLGLTAVGIAGIEVKAERPETVVAPDRDVHALRSLPVASGGTTGADRPPVWRARSR